MEGSVADLSRYRLARAKEDLDTAKRTASMAVFGLP